VRSRVDTQRTVETPEGVELALRVARPYPRALAYVLDALVRMFVYSLVGGLLGKAGTAGTGVMLVVVFLGEWFYPVVFEVAFGGSTPGKRALGLQVRLDDGRPIGLPASLLRNLLVTVDLVPCGAPAFFSSLLSRDFQRLGDRVAGTVVVHVEERAKPPALSPAEALSPPIALRLEEQAALIEYSVRAPRWPLDRAIEVSDRLAPLTGQAGVEGVRRLLGYARWIEGAR
jgi:uncharacterized RDD family membrane protein YckC